MFWGFGLGDLVHGRLSDRFSARRWVALGGVLTAACNWFTSFGHSMVTLMIPWGINGFVNAMCYGPGIRLIAQWWPRRERGRALGTLGIFIGFAMLIMWLVTGWMAGAFGWRAAFRYPVLWIGFMSLVFWLLVRDKPGDYACHGARGCLIWSCLSAIRKGLSSTLKQPRPWEVQDWRSRLMWPNRLKSRPWWNSPSWRLQPVFMLCKLPLPQDIACLQRHLRRWVPGDDAEGEVFGGPRRRDTHVIEEAIDRSREWIAAHHGLTDRAVSLPWICIEFNADKGWI
jgi:MFS family permease